MGEQTGISWADRTWSPWYGCTQVSMGPHGACEGCYARFISETRQKRVVFGGPGRGEGTRDFRPDGAWKEPLRWEREQAAAVQEWRNRHALGSGVPKPSCFVFPSMCDPFDNHPDLVEPRRRFFDLIRATPNLTWLLLTKRPGNIISLFCQATDQLHDRHGIIPVRDWPRNAAIGCTVVTQEEADRDVPKLLAAKAALKPAFAFLSMEPLLGPVALNNLPWRFNAFDNHPGAAVKSVNALTGEVTSWDRGFPVQPGEAAPSLDWVITGGETDQGPHRARPSHPDWFRSLRDQCAGAGVPFHHKQHGEWVSATQPEVKAVGDRSVAFAEWNGRGFEVFPADALSDADEAEVPTDCAYYKVGKSKAGRTLDGVIHDARPAMLGSFGAAA